MAFVKVETLSGLFQWVTIIAIVCAAVALAYKLIAVLRDSRWEKKARPEDSDYYPPQESDDYVTLYAEEEYDVNEFEKVVPNSYTVDTAEENVFIVINGIKNIYNKGDVITLADGDRICSLFTAVVLKPQQKDETEDTSRQD